MIFPSWKRQSLIFNRDETSVPWTCSLSVVAHAKTNHIRVCTDLALPQETPDGAGLCKSPCCCPPGRGCTGNPTTGHLRGEHRGKEVLQ